MSNRRSTRSPPKIRSSSIEGSKSVQLTSQTKLTSFFRPTDDSSVDVVASCTESWQVQAVTTDQPDGDPVLCPICSTSLDTLAFMLRTTHVNQCMGLYEEETLAGTTDFGETTTNIGSVPKTEVQSNTSGETVAGSSDMNPEPEPEPELRMKRGSRSTSRKLRSSSSTSIKKEIEGDNDIAAHKKKNKKKQKVEHTALNTASASHSVSRNGSSSSLSVKTESDADSMPVNAGIPENEQSKVKLSARAIPFYKVLHFGTKKIAVDAFCYGAIPEVTNYYLTHFHSDHYQGIRKTWEHGLVYCSEVTARLLMLRIGMGPEMIRPLAMNKPTLIDGLEVTLIDANHCPGAAIILFKDVETGKSILHTGDFRACQMHLDVLHKIHPEPLDTVYLDTTYLAPSHCFPSQDCVVNSCADYCIRLKDSGGIIPSTRNTIDRFFAKILPSSSSPSPTGSSLQQGEVNPVVFVGSYVIGKEKLAITVAKALKSKIFPYGSDKSRVLRALQDPDLEELLCDDGLACNVHIVRMSELHPLAIYNHWQVLKTKFTHLVVFSPSGWNFHASKAQVLASVPVSFGFEEIVKHRKLTSGGRVHTINVPYSEHSSFPELRHFVSNVKAKEIIPTVNMERAPQRLSMQEYLEKWTASGDDTKDVAIKHE